jgi:hypothetical protein
MKKWQQGTRYIGCATRQQSSRVFAYFFESLCDMLWVGQVGFI